VADEGARDFGHSTAGGGKRETEPSIDDARAIDTIYHIENGAHFGNAARAPSRQSRS
jgi:hypothetical protein